MSGKDLRLARLFSNSSNRIFVVPIDHGTTYGPIQGLGNYIDTIHHVNQGGADAVVLHKGLLKKISEYPELCQNRYIMHLSASTDFMNKDNKVLVSSVEEAIQLGADGVSVHVNLGVSEEPNMVREFGEISRICYNWGMPLLAMIYNCNQKKADNKIPHVARVAEELGADMVKVEYPGNAIEMKEITESVTIPVLIGGGFKVDSTYKLLYDIKSAIHGGVKGLSIGRNVFQHEDIKSLTKIIYELVHNDLSLEQCAGILELETDKLTDLYSNNNL